MIYIRFQGQGSYFQVYSVYTLDSESSRYSDFGLQKLKHRVEFPTN